MTVTLKLSQYLEEQGIRMPFRDYERLARPTVCAFAVRREGWGELGLA